MANLFDVPQFIQDAPSRAAEPVSNAAPTQAAVVFDNVGKVFAGTRGVSTAALRGRHVERCARRSVRHYWAQRRGQSRRCCGSSTDSKSRARARCA